MRLKVSKSKNSTSLYVIKSIYEDKKRTTKIVEKLGTFEAIKKKYPDKDPYEWALEYIAKLTEAEKSKCAEVIVRYSPTRRITKDEQRTYLGGYLFLQAIYYELGLPDICKSISARHRFTYDLNEILSRLVYGRILEPASKLATHEWARTLLQGVSFEEHHTYRALEVLAKESGFIQSKLYKNSKKAMKRNDAILYYDCTNYFFEIEEESGYRQYGPSKENRPLPLVEMGLFMDGDGMPLAFGINAGNTSEQKTLIPLEKQIMEDFAHSEFVVCTDAGLSSIANRRFNDVENRCFITTQSIKKLKAYLKSWALGESGWRLKEGGEVFDLQDIDEEKHRDSVFYKERWLNDGGLEQRLIITFSPKYRTYQRSIRNRQIKRAEDLIDSHPKRIAKPRQNDFKRLISSTAVTSDGEVADKEVYAIDSTRIAEEEAFDGFYGVCTNLEGDASKIAAINKKRWQIEECFRIMKHEFKARPVFLSRDDRIEVHFMTCFIALMVYRVLERKLDGNYTITEIIEGLKHMSFLKVKGEGYIPSYTRTDFTDSLHELFGFRTDYQVLTKAHMREIFRVTEK